LPLEKSADLGKSCVRANRAAATATRGFFLLAGIAMATWAPMVPFAQARLHLDEAKLGLLLLCMGLGSAAAMPLVGFLGHRYGNRNVMVVGALLVCATLPLLAIAPSEATLGAALVGFGGALGVLDVAMNAQAVDVERRTRRPMMSGFHGLFSVGGLVGSVAMTALLATGAPLLGCTAIIAAGLALIAATQWPQTIRDEPQLAGSRSAFARPTATALLLGALCLIAFLAEGAMLDWSAVFLRSARGFDFEAAGLGYAAFSIAMATGRMLGDRITAALGPAQVVRLGSLLAAGGLALATMLPWPATSLTGFVLVGLGASNIVPVLFSAAGRIPGTSARVSIATVTMLGYAGILAGPAVIGFAARATSLPIALGAIAGLLIAVSACASIARR
jgi:predicted MFS family arabinose efflux permease